MARNRSKKKKKSVAGIEIQGERIYLRSLGVRDISKKYISWLNDREVNRFLSIRGQRQSYETVRDYVDSFKRSQNKILLGIFLKDNDQHIGNVTISSIDWQNKFGAVGLCIGDKKCWRKGYGSEVLKCVKELVFGMIGLNRLEASVNVENTASVALFGKAGFKVEGRLRQREKMGNRYLDGVIMGILRSEYKG